jgi:acetolactate synthase I/II/III large subunit
MVRVGDYVAQFLKNKGVEHIFMVTGGGAMFLNDGISKEPSITPIFNHHEQASTMAAVAYSKVNNKIGVVMPTTGCGGTNTITGLLDAWQDSNKLLVISGQVNTKEVTSLKPELGLRKLGVQEANITDIVKPITKWSLVVDDPKKIKFYLEKAFYLISNKRPGPVWLDIPLDVQGSFIDPNSLESFTPPTLTTTPSDISNLLKNSQRPVIIAGYGIHLGDARKEFQEFVEKYKIPVTFTYLSIDLLPSNHPQYIGRLGTKGDRAGNFAVQNADLILSIGSSLSIPVTGFRYDTFAREAKIVVIDVDPLEHKKPTIKIDEFIECDSKLFLESNMDLDYECNLQWLEKCNEWKHKWPVHNPKNKKLNLYSFTKTLSDSLDGTNSTIITDAGSAYYVLCQALLINQNRFITSGAQAEMGFTLPACIGASFANPNSNIIGVTGDGSFQFNIQELQTIVQYNLPIKIFVLNNDGYMSIKNTQDKFFEGRYFGVNSDSNVSFPSTKKISKAYGLDYFKFSSLNKLKEGINSVLNNPNPTICEVILPSKEAILPSSSAKVNEEGKMVSQPLENMFPFLSKKEFNKEMIVKILK